MFVLAPALLFWGVRGGTRGHVRGLRSPGELGRLWSRLGPAYGMFFFLPPGLAITCVWPCPSLLFGYSRTLTSHLRMTPASNSLDPYPSPDPTEAAAFVCSPSPGGPISCLQEQIFPSSPLPENSPNCLLHIFFPVTIFASHWKPFHLPFELGLGASSGPLRCCFCYQLEYKSTAIYQRYT